MFDYLIGHAVANVWCTPEQDLQLILQPARLTPINGRQRYLKVAWEDVDLPTTTDYYHVYQIGQLPPIIYGIVGSYSDWTDIATICNNETMVINLYTGNGRQIARFDSFFRVLNDGNVLVAIKDQSKINDLNTDSLFIRFYSNAYFASVRSDKTRDIIYVEGKRIKVENDISLILQSVRNYRKMAGAVDVCVNGVIVNEPVITNTKVGDIVEFIYDSSVYKTYDLDVYGVNGSTFVSTLDGRSKTLLMPEVTPDDWIDYADDIDVYLIYPDGTNMKGFYFNKNHERFFRNVTHKDYSIDNEQIESIRANNTSIVSQSVTPKVRLRIRHGGYQRPLINEHHRIKELYKLPYAKIRKAMIGTDSTVPEWKAAALEASDYCKLMAAKSDTIDIATVQNGYGYNAITKLVADSPIPVTTDLGLRLVQLPVESTTNATIFEYDSSGFLLGTYQHGSGDTWVPRNATTTMVEAWPSPASHQLDITFGADQVAIDETFTHRFYRCPIVNGTPTYIWEDISDTGLYSIHNSTVSWGFDQTAYLTAIKSDQRALVYQLTLNPVNGLYRFSVTNTEIISGTTVTHPMTIPPGMLELWLNGRSLIEGLDYFVKWPQVILTNKRYLNQNGAETITVKCTGFCNSDMSRETAPDVGFVKYHTLSRNSRFDIRDDKVCNIVVAGARYMRSEVTFAEDDDSIHINDEVNGWPYAIWSTAIPLRKLIDVDSQAFREIALGVDKRISDYLTPKIIDRSKDYVDLVPAKYEIVSPFVSNIIEDVRRGVISKDRIHARYTESDIAELVADYLYLLDYEPSKLGVDLQYVLLHPHTYYGEITVDIYQYTFIDRVIRMYLDDAIDITPFIKIGAPT